MEVSENRVITRGPDGEESNGWLHVQSPGEFWLIHGHAASAMGPTLELGSGAGRFTQSLAENGITVVGLELGDWMIGEARRRQEAALISSSRLEYVQGDMRDFHLDRKFGLVTVPFATFWRHMTKKEAAGCLDCIKEALVKGGTFLIENPQQGHPDYDPPERPFWDVQKVRLGFSYMVFRYRRDSKYVGAMLLGQFRP